MSAIGNRFFFLIILCFLGLNSNAQDDSIKNSFFIFPEFSTGSVFMKKGLKINTSLNYNSFTNKMIYIENGKKLEIGNVEDVNYVLIDQRKFYSFNDIFIELIHHSTSDLFVEYSCKLIEIGRNSGYGGISKTTAITSYLSIRQNDVVNLLELPDNFQARQHLNYWVRKNGKFKKVTSIKKIIKLYKKNASTDAFIKTNNINFDDKDSMIKLFKFLEQQN